MLADDAQALERDGVEHTLLDRESARRVGAVALRSSHVRAARALTWLRRGKSVDRGDRRCGACSRRATDHECCSQHRRRERNMRAW